METADRRTSGFTRISLIAALSLLAAFLTLYLVLSVMAPARKLALIGEEFSSGQTGENAMDERKFSDSAYLRLLRDKSFLQSRIAMAETDSIYLTINLADSTANIEISGVAVHKVKVENFRVSKMLRKGDERLVYFLLSEPFNIEKDWSSIKKEPVMLKIAPKDTSEYKPDIIPDTSIVEPVNYIFQMTNGTKVYVYQSERDEFGERLAQFRFDLRDRIMESRETLSSVVRLKVPEYHPHIKIYLPRADAKRIYRALPRYGQVGIYR
jgi:hypothetical protein